MGLPPSEPTLKSTAIAPVSSATVEMAGAPGTERGVAVRSAEAVLAPAALTARTRTVVAVPLARPPIVKVVAAEPVDTHSVEVPSWYS